MASRNQTIITLSRTSAFLLLLVLLLVNVAAARSTVRIDLTEEGRYTLSDGSRRILSSLEDPAAIRVFWHEVPEDSETTHLYIRSLLDEMRSAAEGRLTVRWVDMDDPDGMQEAEEAQVPVDGTQSLGEGELHIDRFYDSLVVEVGGQEQRIDQLVGKERTLEYELVSRLHWMTTREQGIVGLVASRPPPNPFMGMSGGGGRFRALEQILRLDYGGGDPERKSGVRTTLTLDEPIPPDVDVLLVVAPENLTEEQVYRLEQYLLGGGRVVLLVDPVHAPPLEAPSSQATTSGLEDWLEHLGITIESGVVGDFGSFTKRAKLVRLGDRQMPVAMDYFYWLRLHRAYMNDANPATRGIGNVPLFWPAAIAVDEAKQAQAGRNATVLARTTKYGYRRSDLIGLDTADEDQVREEDCEEVPLIVLLEGPMESFWKGKPVPGEEKPDEAPDEGEGAEDEEAAPEGEEGTPEGEEGAPPEEGAEPAGEEAAPGEEAAEPAGEEAPDEPAPESEPAEEPADEADEEEGPPRLESGRGLLLVIGDAELVDDTAYWYAQRLPGPYRFGFTFIENVLDWLIGTEDLIALRAKVHEERIIDKPAANEQQLIKWVNMLGFSLLVFFAGAVVFFVRRYQT